MCLQDPQIDSEIQRAITEIKSKITQQHYESFSVELRFQHTNQGYFNFFQRAVAFEKWKLPVKIVGKKSIPIQTIEESCRQNMFMVIENCNKFNDHILLDNKILGKEDNPSLKF